MSKDERMDLTKFVNYVDGPWVSVRCRIVTAYNHPIIVRQYAEKENPQGDDCRLLLGEVSSNIDGHLMAAAPELLDALKKAYEEIDLLRRKIRLLDVVHDIPNALDAEIKGYGHFREEELAGLYDASEEE